MSKYKYLGIFGSVFVNVTNIRFAKNERSSTNEMLTHFRMNKKDIGSANNFADRWKLTDIQRADLIKACDAAPKLWKEHNE